MKAPNLTRRDFLATGCALAGATLAGTATGCFPDRSVSPVGPPGARALLARDGDLLDPPVLQSVAGMLTATITVDTSPALVGGRRALEPVTYNGTFPGPTLWVRPGDIIDLMFVNHIRSDEDDEDGYGRPPRPSRMSNLHYHGMHVPPTGTADNMTVVVPANGRHHYYFQVPLDHPAGLYWYHAHVHGLVTSQVSRGAAGMIYVANAYTDLVASLGIRHRLLMLQQAYFEPGEKRLISDDGERDDPQLALSLINGELMPDLLMRPGEVQVWSILNASSSAFYELQLDGHTFDVIAEDGIPLVAPRLGRATLLLPSARRFEVVVRASTTAGRYTLRYNAYNQGVDTWPAREVATVAVGGRAWTGASHPGVDTSATLVDLSAQPVPDARKRSLVLGQDDTVPEGEFGRFTINGHAWDPAHSEWTGTLGTVERESGWIRGRWGGS